MQQLNGIDAAFLSMDTSTVSMEIGSMCLLDPSTSPDEVTLGKLTSLVASRMHLLEPYRRRLVRVPFGLDRPYWVEDDRFDLGYHVREVALASPGTDAQLAELVARLHARPTDRGRPLWELYLVHGLAGGRKAIYSKTHHAMVDGVLGAEILSILWDRQPEPLVVEPPRPWHGEQEPSAVGMLARSLRTAVAHPVRAARVGYSVVRSVPAIAVVPNRPRVPLLDDLLNRNSGLVLQSVGFRAPATPFNKPVSPHRRYAFTVVPFEDVRMVKRLSGSTVNDVVMAVAAGALRRWLLDHDALPEGPLVAGVPVSVRTPDEMSVAANKISAMLAALPTHLAEPVERLRACSSAMRAAKDIHGALPTSLLCDVTQFAMPALATQAARLAGRLRVMERVSPVNLVVSNVPGPAEDMFYVGCRVLGYYPISALTDGQGLNITVTSLTGRMHLGVTADRELVPDVDRIRDYFVDEVGVLLRAVQGEQSKTGSRKRVPALPAYEVAP